MESLYFLITDSGRAAHQDFVGWPFDETGDMLADWTPPEFE